MKELEQWLASCGFNVVPVCDGRIHRFDRDGKKNAWLWCVQLFSSKDGSPFFLATVGDWRTDEKFEFKTNAAYSKEDQRAITDKIKEAARKAEKEKLAHQLEVADQAKQAFEQFNAQGSTPYLERKKINDLFGCRIDGTTLVVPARDVDGKLWGYQRVYEDGKKYFLSGQRKEFCFHVIPTEINFKEQEVVYVCEGFATGCSIHRATGKPVVVAFDAGNLSSVVKSIKGPAIIVCGDDDQWTEKNPGREKAESAAKAVLGKAVFPKFADKSSKPTDFNDLHLLEGIAEVKKQIELVAIEKHYIKALGYNDNMYFYTSSSNKQIMAIGGHSSDNLMSLQPFEYWDTMYQGKRGINWDLARSDLKAQCRAKGIFEVDNVRGPGIWNDAGRIVIHLGNRLLVDGEQKDIHGIETEYIYQLARAERGIHKDPLSVQECGAITDILLLLQTERMEQKFFLGGWIVAAHLSGILNWRPHIVVTGQKGSGKSTVVNEFVKPLLSKRYFAFGGTTSEAGIRQKVKSSAKPFVFDEFESDDKESQNRIKRCLELIRQASTDSGHVVKGSVTGESISYTTRFCALIAAIFPQIENSADKSRFTKIDIKPVEGDRDKQWATLQKAMCVINDEFCERFFARIVSKIQLFNANLRLFEAVLAKKHSMRFAQQYAPLLAGWQILLSDAPVDEWDARTLVDGIALDQELGTGGEQDEDLCLQAILDRRIYSDRDKMEMTISEIIKHVLDRTKITVDGVVKGQTKQMDVWTLYNELLGRYGMYVDPDFRTLFVASTNVEMSKIMFTTRWPSNWNEALRRIPCVVEKNDRQRLVSGNKKGVRLSLRDLFP